MRPRRAAERLSAVVTSSGHSASTCTATRSAWKRSGARSWPRCASGTRPVRGDARAARRFGRSGMPWRPRRHARRAGGGALLRGPGGRGRNASAARARGDHQAAGRARSAHGRAPAWSRDPGHPPGGSMNALTPYAAFFMRLAVGLVFLQHGWYKFHHMGVAGVAGMLHNIGFPFATIFAVILIAVETIGAICVVIGFYTRFWAACMAIEMLVAILAVQLPKGSGFEVEGLLFAGAVTLIALGDGPLSIAVKLKHSST